MDSNWGPGQLTAYHYGLEDFFSEYNVREVKNAFREKICHLLESNDSNEMIELVKRFIAYFILAGHSIADLLYYLCNDITKDTIQMNRSHRLIYRIINRARCALEIFRNIEIYNSRRVIKDVLRRLQSVFEQ